MALLRHDCRVALARCWADGWLLALTCRELGSRPIRGTAESVARSEGRLRLALELGVIDTPGPVDRALTWSQILYAAAAVGSPDVIRVAGRECACVQSKTVSVAARAASHHQWPTVLWCNLNGWGINRRTAAYAAMHGVQVPVTATRHEPEFWLFEFVPPDVAPVARIRAQPGLARFASGPEALRIVHSNEFIIQAVEAGVRGQLYVPFEVVAEGLEPGQPYFISREFDAIDQWGDAAPLYHDETTINQFEGTVWLNLTYTFNALTLTPSSTTLRYRGWWWTDETTRKAAYSAHAGGCVGWNGTCFGRVARDRLLAMNEL